MDHIQFPYRSSSHLALMHVINETGAWERNGLKVDFDKIISRGDAHDLVPKGEVEFVSGNHVSTYAARAKGDTWQYLGQTVSKNKLFLITRQDSGINKLEDVRKRKFGNRGRHPGLNTWLYLKQAGLDPDKDEVELVTEKREEDEAGAKKVKGKSLLNMVADSDVDAAFVNQPRTEQARRMGLKVIDIPVQDMIFFMTISSSAKMVTERPDVVKRVLKSVLEGIAYFKQNRDETIKILMNKHKKEGDLDLEMAAKVYDDLSSRLEPKLYPGLAAVYNVYQEALKQDEKNGDAAKIHPLALWNMNFLREIDDSGFITNLYKKNPQMLNGYGG
jgi:ABC-type nitrate/sulfonate/bicarbonate transport system substrate-binding protein